MTAFELHTQPDTTRAEELVGRLVEYNKAQSPTVRQRFEPANLATEPVQVFALDGDQLVGGCTGRVERIWHWLTVDILWVADSARGHGLGNTLLRALEDEGRARGCRWSDLNTFDFQAPDFYRKAGYTEYGAKVDYPPGHTNYLFRKDL